jgi:hypothetical protein
LCSDVKYGCCIMRWKDFYKLLFHDIIVVVLSWPRSHGKCILIYIYLYNHGLSTLPICFRFLPMGLSIRTAICNQSLLTFSYCFVKNFYLRGQVWNSMSELIQLSMIRLILNWHSSNPARTVEHTIKRDALILRHITLFMRDRHDVYRMTLSFVLILVLMFYCTSGIRAMSIQNESDHAQKINASLFIVSSVHVVRTTGSLFSDYDLRVSECDYVTTGNCLWR